MSVLPEEKEQKKRTLLFIDSTYAVTGVLNVHAERYANRRQASLPRPRETGSESEQRL